MNNRLLIPLHKKQAIEMRRRGNSIGFIADQMSRSKATIHAWVRDIPNERLLNSHKNCKGAKPLFGVKRLIGRVKIKNVYYTVYQSNMVEPKTGAYISYYYKEIVIRFGYRLDGKEFKTCFLHEIIHGLDPTLSEEQVSNLTTGLYDTVTNYNGWYFLPSNYLSIDRKKEELEKQEDGLGDINLDDFKVDLSISPPT